MRAATAPATGREPAAALTDILNQCAWSAARSRNTYLSAHFWRLARRIGKKKAAVAVGHSILVICWHLLTNNVDAMSRHVIDWMDKLGLDRLTVS